MNSEPIPSKRKRLLVTAHEYLTHWFIAGIIVTLTGFTPDHWVAHFFHYTGLSEAVLHSIFPADYRMLAVGVGIAVVTGDIFFKNRRRRQRIAAVAPVIDGMDEVLDMPSIAVLPFVNMSGEIDQEYFADGITEDIINGLSCDSRIFVIARNSTFAYKGQSPDIRSVGKDLGVRYVLEGSIRPINDRLRITVQLIETCTGTHVWADKVDRPTAEIFDITDDVVDGLITALCSNLGVAEAKRAARQRPEDLHAWALCVQAEAVYLLQPGGESLVAAEKLLLLATEIEPGYGASWALLAYLTSVQNAWGVSTDPAEDADKALSLASRALSLAPHDPMVLGYSGIAYTWVGQTALAVDYLERSLDINPNSGLCRLFYGAALWADGRPETGIDQLNLFLRLSPKDPNAGFAHHYLSYCYLALDNFQEAEQSARNAVKLIPGFAGGYFQLAMSLAALGHAAEAQQQIAKARDIVPSRTREALEESWRLAIRKPEQAEKMVTLLRMAWTE